MVKAEGPVRIKVCGITNEKDALAAVEFGADAVGFVFAEGPRKVSPETVKKIVRKLSPFIIKVGVFVNEVPSMVCKIARECMLNVIQLHGEEIPEFCRDISMHFPVIKSVRVRNANDIKMLSAYKDFSNAFLLDTFVKGKKGGTGKTFDWNLCKEANKLCQPIILAGGLNAKNVREAILKVRPFAVDVSSGVESKPGKKDHKKMKEFIRIASKNV